MSTQNGKDGGGIDFKALGRLFEARRLALGMRPGEFAVFAGVSYPNSKDGSSVRAVELYGKPCLLTIVRAAAALGIDEETVRLIGGLELATMCREWEAWAAEPVPVVMSIWAIPGFWIQKLPPDGLDRAAILAWANAEFPAHVRCVRWSRKHATFLRPGGTSYEVHSAFGDEDPGPIMRFK